MIRFANPELLWLMVPAAVVLFVAGRRRRPAAVAFPDVSALKALGARPGRRGVALRGVLRFVTLASLIAAVARPQVVHSRHQVEASGVDMMLALDISGSMAAMDLELDGQLADRLSVVKSVVHEFIERRPSDRIGLVGFAAGGYLVSPLTLDHGWLHDNLDRLQLGLVPDGTAIGSALATSVNRLREEDAKSKVVVLLTDGVNNAGAVQPELAAEAAAAEGVKVHTIAVGTEGRAPIPVRQRDGRTEVVMADVEIDEATLQDIAETTGGRFFRAVDAEGLQAIYAEIDALEKTTRVVETIEDAQERFVLFALLGLSLMAAELLTLPALRRALP